MTYYVGIEEVLRVWLIAGLGALLVCWLLFRWAR